MLGIVKRTEEEFAEWLAEEWGFLCGLASFDDEPLVLEPYQIAFLQNRSRFRWVTKSRQVGFSFLFALEALARCHLREKHTAVFVSYNLDDAKEKILVARQVHEELPLAYQKRLVVDSKTELAFESNGPGKRISRILSNPSKAPRGKKGDCYLDELAHYVNDREVYRGSTALILRSFGQLSGCSTPLGRRGIFWEIATESLRLIVQLGDRLKGRSAALPLQGRIAYVDSSHGERFSQEAWNDNAIAGLHLNLMRNGYLSFGLRSFDAERLQRADLLVLIAPSQPFSKTEKRAIAAFVNGGGTLLLTVGYEERAASVPLLELFGFAVDNLPLAQFISIIAAANQKVRFAEAWPVVSIAPGAEVVASYRELPVIMRRPVGRGQVFVIGDSSFFWNQNLELEETYMPENVQFLQWLLGSLNRQPKDGP